MPGDKVAGVCFGDAELHTIIECFSLLDLLADSHKGSCSTLSYPQCSGGRLYH